MITNDTVSSSSTTGDALCRPRSPREGAGAVTARGLCATCTNDNSGEKEIKKKKKITKTGGVTHT